MPVAVGAPLLIGIGVTPYMQSSSRFWAKPGVTPLVHWRQLGRTGYVRQPCPGDAGLSGKLLLAGLFIWMWNVVTGWFCAGSIGKAKELRKAFRLY